MKFLALVNKELRECLPWLLLAVVVFLFFGTLLLRVEIVHGQSRYDNWNEHAGTSLHSYRLFVYQPLQMIGPLLLMVGPGLGIVLGARQFLLPTFMKTWAFTVHRSVTRQTILRAKVISALICFVVSLGVLWSLFYLYASRPGVFKFPPKPRVFVEGWIYILMGMIVYFGTVLSAISTTRWYTTRTFGLVFSGWVFFLVMSRYSLVWCMWIIIISLAILILQIRNTFLSREF